MGLASWTAASYPHDVSASGTGESSASSAFPTVENDRSAPGRNVALITQVDQPACANEGFRSPTSGSLLLTDTSDHRHTCCLSGVVQ